MQFLQEEAVFISFRNDGCYYVTLFQIEGFYVELFFHKIKLMYEKILIFEDTRPLDPYLNRIDITELCDCRH